MQALLLPSIFLPLLAAAHDDDGPSWPGWRGPDRNDVSRETEWVAEGKDENVWAAEVGIGYSSVTVQNGRLYTMGYDEEARLDLVWCLDAKTGEEVWAHPYEAEIWDRAHRGGTVNTPTIDGAHVFALNREGNLFCFSAKSGRVRWHRQLQEEHGLTPPTWGFSGSPVVIGDELFLNLGKVVCLDKKTGDLSWATETDYGHAYSTPTLFDVAGQPALAILNGNGAAVVGRTDGKELGFYEWTSTGRGINASAPVVVGDKLFVSSSLKGGGALLELTEEGLTPVWENKEMATQLSGCVLMDDHLYGFNQSILKCIGIDGEESWSQRGIGNGALMGAPGRLIAMSSKGELIVAEATPAEYRELSRKKLFDSGVYWTKPVLVDGLIYCRSNEGQLVCRDHRAEE